MFWKVFGWTGLHIKGMKWYEGLKLGYDITWEDPNKSTKNREIRIKTPKIVSPTLGTP